MLNKYNLQLYLFPKFVEEYSDEPKTQAQLELKNFWERPKNNVEKGVLYERYVGYLYEEAGYYVEYTGITKGVKDMGRDLICRYGRRVLIIQCKNWGYDKKIHAKYIYQLHGSVEHYRRQYPNRRVYGVFFTTSRLSLDAVVAASRLGIETHDRLLLRSSFPIIKCQKSTKKYYLPDDWHYDKIKLNLSTGDFYCMTVAEAESKGFKRAF